MSGARPQTEMNGSLVEVSTKQPDLALDVQKYRWAHLFYARDEAMIHLLEDQFGFSDDRLGFPSVRGCRAVLYQNASGMFGYHNRGDIRGDQWQKKVGEFADFVRRHASGGGKGLMLTLTTFVPEVYGGSFVSQCTEARGFAEALRYQGRLTGCDLSREHDGTRESRFVEYRRVGSVHLVFSQKWQDDMGTKGDFAAGPNFAGRLSQPTKKMITGVTAAALSGPHELQALE